jgi:two-component system sensor histidine kinase/response regulator
MNTTASSGPRILTVEDDGAIRATLVDMLEVNGFLASSAVNGLEGLAKAQREDPDVILTDVAMPGMGGFELIKALKADDRTRAIPVIVISASVEQENIRQAMDLGAEDFLLKPFTEEQVVRSIRARLEKKALLDELDAFAHTVAHDLKNPITMMMGRVGLMRMVWDTADDALLLKQVDELEAGTTQLNNIIDELLILAGVGRQTVQPKPVAMEWVVKEALGRIDNLVQKSKAQVELPATWPVALGHAPWIIEVWMNYLSNAVKYGGTPPQIQLGADLLPERKCVRFWVQDNGAGLTPGEQDKLFRAFSRIAHTRAQGHGLGLSIVRRIIEKLGGVAGVDSQPGSGSRFWFELPEAGAT